MSLRNAPWNWMRRQWEAGGGPKVPPLSFTDPTFGGNVLAIIDDGAGGKFVGGDWTSVTCNVTSTTYTTGYQRLIHLLPNGEVDAAWSCPSATSVNALVLDTLRDRLYVAVRFTGAGSVGGVGRKGLAAVQASTGVTVTAWRCDAERPGTTSWVNTIALDAVNDILYAGGRFTVLGGLARNGLGAIAATSGTTLTDWVCDLSGGYGAPQAYALELDITNDHLYVGGFFSFSVSPFQSGLFRASASTGVKDATWKCDASGPGTSYPACLIYDGDADRLYIGGTLSSIDGKTRYGLGAVTASTGDIVTAWVCNVRPYDAFVYSMVLDKVGDVLYVGGTFNGATGLGGLARNRLGAIVASTGAVIPEWVCDAGSTVRALQLDPANDALFAGGLFSGATGLDGEQRDRFGTVVASTGDLHVP